MLEGQTVIFGGSFNPPHNGHALVCRYLLDSCRAEEVWMVPVNNHPLGKTAVGFEHRLQMCRFLAASVGSRVVVSDVERQLGGMGRTFDLLVHLADTYPDRVFALGVGADILHETEKWHRWNDICELVQIVVLGREGVDRRGTGGAVKVGAPDLPDISSTQIRARVKKTERIDQLTVPEVANYITEESLYRE